MRRHILAILILFLYGTVLYAAGFEESDQKEITNFDTLFAGEAGGFSVVGGSLITEEGETKKEDYKKFWVHEKKKVAKAWLIWMGEAAENTIEFYAHKKWHKLKSTKKFSDKDLVLHVVEVSAYVKKSCRVGVKNFSFQPKTSVGGWSLMASWLGQEGQLFVYQGLARLSPSERFKFNLTTQALPKYKLNEIAVVGGGGMAGNGSMNFLDSQNLSSGDDWNSSAGYLWDVDSYLLEKSDITSKKPHFLTIDPLLQWLFPTAIICYLKRQEVSLISSSE